MSIKDILRMLTDKLLVEADWRDIDVSVEGQSEENHGQLILKIKVEGKTKIIKVNATQLMAVAG